MTTPIQPILDAIDAYAFTQSCYEGMPPTDPNKRAKVYLTIAEWELVRDILAARVAEQKEIQT